MGTSQIPADVAAAIKQCWPDGIVEEFATDASYFHEIRPQLERDLRAVRGASLRWQTEEDEPGGCRDNDDELPCDDEWQSYWVFFLGPDSEEFHVETETTGLDEREGSDEDGWAETTFGGERWIGCAVGISLAAPYAVINLCGYSRYEDGTVSLPDVESFIYSETTGEAVDSDQHHREILSHEAFRKLEELRDRIVSILERYRIRVLDTPVLNLPERGLKASPDVLLEEPLRVRDAFFFRAV